LALFAGGTAWLGGRRGLRLFSGSRRMMGARATILLAEQNPARAGALVTNALDEMEAVDRLMSRFDANSDVGRANRARGEWVPIARSTAVVVEQALAVARSSDGSFDPALDRLTERWGFHDRRAPSPIPGRTELTPWLGGELHRAIHTRKGVRGWEVRVGAPQAGLDLGGIAKGYAIDSAAALLRDHGVRHALVEAGGDLFALGGHPNGDPWPIGVRDPRDARRLQGVIGARDEGVATSGDYENFFEAGGRRYAHLLEPHAASPARFLSSLTVQAPSAALADALATSGCAQHDGTSRELLSRMLSRLGARAWRAVDSAGREWRG
jgi:thiamine biosynthesis lipoprotein